MRQHTYTTEHVPAKPKDLKDGVLYVRPHYNLAVHRCMCGCGEEVITPIDEKQRQDARVLGMVRKRQNVPCIHRLETSNSNVVRTTSSKTEKCNGCERSIKRMFKKIRKYFALKKRIELEKLETLATICKYLEHEGYCARNPYSRFMHSHFEELKSLSKELRNEENQR